jgi:hypothetical protein
MMNKTKGKSLQRLKINISVISYITKTLKPIIYNQNSLPKQILIVRLSSWAFFMLHYSISDF